MQRQAPGEEVGRMQIAQELLQAVVYEDAQEVQALLEDPRLTPESVNWQDQLGWTPLIYAAFRGEYRLVKKLINRGATVNHMALSRSGSSADGTTPLHACAAMRPSRYTTKDGFYETARVLMLAGGNPYQENLAGLTPIDVAANRSNTHMKVLLEGCALFKGILILPIAKLFGGRPAERYCIVLPRFAWHPLGSQNGLLMRDGNPTLSLICYKDPEDLKPLVKIPLDGARIVVEGGSMTEEGYLIVKAARKQLKGISVKSSTSSSCIVEIRARASATQAAAHVLQSLAEVCKSAAVAAYCGNLGQLCEASMIEALHNLGLAEGLLALPGFQPIERPRPMSIVPEAGPVAPEMIAEEENSRSRRKSLSLARLGKAALRRFSIGDKPRRGSMESSRSGERMSDSYPGTKARQQAAMQSDFTRISEETSQTAQQPIDWGTVSQDLPSLPNPSSRRYSMAQHEEMRRPKKENRRLSLGARYTEGREILVSNQGIPMDFWSGMRDQMMRRSIDGRPASLNSRRLSTSRQPSQPVNVRASFDVGDLDDVINPLNTQTEEPAEPPRRSTASRATEVLDARRPADSTMQDWVQQAAQKYDDAETYEQWKQPPAASARASRHSRPTIQAVGEADRFRGDAARHRPPPSPSADKGHAGERRNSGSRVVGPATPPISRADRERDARSGPDDLQLHSAASTSRVRPERQHSSGARARKSESSHQRESLHSAPPAYGLPPPPPPPVVNLSNILRTQTSRSDKSNGRAPRPASKSGFSTSDWFGSGGGETDFFNWRPDGRASRVATNHHPTPPGVAPGTRVDPAVARWAAEAASLVKGDLHDDSAALDEFARAGWHASDSGPSSAAAAAERTAQKPGLKGSPAPATTSVDGLGVDGAEEQVTPSQPQEASRGLKQLVADGKALQQRQTARRASRNPALLRAVQHPAAKAPQAEPEASAAAMRRSSSSSSSFFSDSSSEGAKREAVKVVEATSVTAPNALSKAEKKQESMAVPQPQETSQGREITTDEA